MSRATNRGRRSGRAAVALAAMLIAVGAGAWAWIAYGPTADPLEAAQSAYRRGDWPAAAAGARDRLKTARDDADALLLLARASARQGRDEVAQGLYRRVGPDRMAAEDYFLLGAGLARQGQDELAWGALEQAQALDPDHLETLHELARTHLKGRRPAEAAAAAGRLAALPGGEARGHLVIGRLGVDDRDPSAASAALQRALAADPTLAGGSMSPAEARKLLARSLLQLGRGAEARDPLDRVLAEGRDPEASWLSSRALLQIGRPDAAAEALVAAGGFGRSDPTMPDPSPYVGSARCGECHPAQWSEQSSRHARTFARNPDLARYDLPDGPRPDADDPTITHDLRHENGRVIMTTRDATRDRALEAVADYAMGSGDRGMTLVGRDKSGQPRELRLSYYDGPTGWARTIGHPPRPADRDHYLGSPRSPEAMRRCLECHTTHHRAGADPEFGPESADRGIGCERCHGPGGNHVLAVEAGLVADDPAIGRPSAANAEQITTLCGQCHRPADGPMLAPDNPLGVRFQAATLPRSRCYTEGRGRFDCVTCHDPHRDAETSPAHYEARCLACHGATPPAPGSEFAAMAAGLDRLACPVNPAGDCIRCHMPTVGGTIAPLTFTDHHIRVHKP